MVPRSDAVTDGAERLVEQSFNIFHTHQFIC